jgi:hypothetical protein
MVRDGRHATKPEDDGERQRVKEHVKSMLQKLVSKNQQPSDHKRPE